MIRYDIIQAGDLPELTRLVNEAIEKGKGYPLGGVCSFNRVDSETTWVETWFCQAMINTKVMLP